MFGIGIGEIVLIILIIFIISPRDLPRVMRKAGEFFNELGKLKRELLEIKKDVAEITKEGNIKKEPGQTDNNTKRT